MGGPAAARITLAMRLSFSIPADAGGLNGPRPKARRCEPLQEPWARHGPRATPTAADCCAIAAGRCAKAKGSRNLAQPAEWQIRAHRRGPRWQAAVLNERLRSTLARSYTGPSDRPHITVRYRTVLPRGPCGPLGRFAVPGAAALQRAPMLALSAAPWATSGPLARSGRRRRTTFPVSETRWR